MADACESKKRKGRPPLSLSEKKRRKAVRETERSLSRVCLGDQFVRWRALMKELEMSSDTEMAKFLLDRPDQVNDGVEEMAYEEVAFGMEIEQGRWKNLSLNQKMKMLDLVLIKSGMSRTASDYQKQLFVCHF